MKNLLLISCLLITTFLVGQSTHETELLTHPDTGQQIIPKKKAAFKNEKTTCTLNKTVFGWHPYWMNGAEANYEWDLISDFCFFAYEVDATTGNATSTHGFSTNDAVDTALVKGKQVHLCVTLFSNHATFFGNTTAQTTLINNLINSIQARGAHGINIDFEGVPSSQSANLTTFMTNLGTALHAANPNFKLSMCLYAVDWNNVFDEVTLNNSVDFYTIMGYDYYYSGSSQAGPTDPLYGFSNTYDYSLSRSVSYYLNAGIPTSKLILGLPYYGREWETTSNSIPGSTTGNNVFSRIYDFVRANTSGNYNNPIHSNRSSSNAYIFQNAGTWRQCWISEENELKERYDLVNRRNLKGIGIWALGYDDGYNELWTAIQDKLTTCNQWACSDTLYDEGGPEVNYYNNEKVIYTISPPGATSINVNFLEFSTEADFDTLWLYDGASTASPLIGFYQGIVGPGQFTTTTGHLTLYFKSDGSTRSSGWKMAYQCVQDTISPIVASSINATWVNENTAANFTSTDNIGVVTSYWNAQSWDQNSWHSNPNTGHCYDEFDFQSNWNAYAGTWNYSNGTIVQSDESNTNTSFGLAMPLTSSDDYLFQFDGQVAGSGTNRRAGLHFMCSDLSLPNRGNSYFVWFRIDSDVIQLYEVTNDVFSLTASFPFILQPNNDYDCKISYNSQSGLIQVYVDNQFVGSWTDLTPLQISTGISLRTGNAIFKVNKVVVYSGRNISETILVGSNGHFYTSNPTPITEAGKIANIGIDAAHNIGYSEQLYHVDYTLPILSLPTEENPDIDTLLNSFSLNLSNLSAIDTNSSITLLKCQVEHINGSIILNPFDVSSNTSFETLNGLNHGEYYRIKVYAENGAGLSDTIFSDGFIYLSTIGNSEISMHGIEIYPNPTTSSFIIKTMKDQEIFILDNASKIVHQQKVMKGDSVINTENWSAGNYFIYVDGIVIKLVVL